jgi:hypothetical protein
MMNGNTRIVDFEHELTDIGNIYKVISIINPSLLPIELQGFNVTAAYIEDWIERRVIPANRHHMQAVLSVINKQKRPEMIASSTGTFSMPT